MSNLIRYDPLLVRALSGELRAALQGRQALPQPVFDADLSCTLPLDRGQALRFDLHPQRGWIRLVGDDEAATLREDLDLSARVVRVSAPADERLLRVDLHEGGRFRGGRRSLVVELHTNQWNALLVDSEDRRIVSVLRARDAGGRTLRPGAVYRPPEPAKRTLPDRPRAELLGAWMSRLSHLPPAERARELVRRFAYTSPVNAASLLGPAATREGEDALAAAFDRWWELADGDPDGAFVLHTPQGPQPYPIPLDGVSYQPADSLLGAMETAAGAAPAEGEEDVAGALLARARKRLAGAERRIGSLRAELAGVGEAERLRAHGDLLLAHLDWAEPGASSVVLPDFDGGETEVSLDPALKPHENAERLYAEARRRARAEARIPEVLEQAERDRERWAGAVDALERGEVPEWVTGALLRSEQKEKKSRAQPVERLPYRLYRTSGGLEVRVGRTSKDNDRLTFGNCLPSDVWLHARSVPGSHVVLRWAGEGAPPARDLEEAATLAAWYSKARTSGTVAVDWTRRKYVRKPRGAPPGRVSILHAKTVFVAPDGALEERLRAE
ncbi:NFACT RNA binding domain-containing protein [Longimicrobium sp.]|uniref:NFACT RNA binding domain-containing protein n=1 Tax=Longimicrobium sp. TaxID=2029185 RepID=UPI002E2EF94E|nr:NFACT RNA binding domain-containing protein [Longimicrobium sp.]HEX6039083.1 NFACT RNA binding domain-containing protein [Longimicrobium sp.]